MKIEEIRKIVKEHREDFIEKYKDVKCIFYGTNYYAECKSSCESTLKSHKCGLFVFGWHKAIERNEE